MNGRCELCGSAAADLIEVVSPTDKGRFCTSCTSTFSGVLALSGLGCTHCDALARVLGAAEPGGVATLPDGDHDAGCKMQRHEGKPRQRCRH